MLKSMFVSSKQVCIFVLFFTFITGVLYPGLVTIGGMLLFKSKIDGSLLYHADVVIGSELIGQNFTANKYFWGRPSATKLYPYNAEYSAGSNFGASNTEFLEKIKQRVADIKKTHNDKKRLVPLDLVTASASGLDPHISLFGAYYQIPRIVQTRNISTQDIINLIDRMAIRSIIPLLGEPRLNVLLLNLELDKLSLKHGINTNG